MKLTWYKWYRYLNLSLGFFRSLSLRFTDSKEASKEGEKREVKNQLKVTHRYVIV